MTVALPDWLLRRRQQSPYQEWRQCGKWREPICPACPRQGTSFCGDCLRWMCREHRTHECERRLLPTEDS